MRSLRSGHRLAGQVRLPRRSGRAMLRLPRSVNVRGPVVESMARWASRATMALSVRMLSCFDTTTGLYQMSEEWNWLSDVNVGRTLGVDGISRFFVRLNGLLTPLCVMASMGSIRHGEKAYYGLFLILEGLVNLVFRSTDRLRFYVAFEAVLVPMFFVIGRWGSRARKVRAGYFFFLYTLFGSLFMLLAMRFMYRELGSRDMVTAMGTMSLVDRTNQRWLWLAFFLAFAVKVPMVPVHIWLPEAHVEAPTAGSVILAGILLKLGTYGMARVLIGFFPEATVYYLPRVYARCVVAMVYTSRTAIRQADMKRVIAYASVAHMNLTLVGLFSRTPQGVEGAILQMLSHGLVSGALFMCVGVLYDRHHTRMISYYGGVAQTMPLYAAIFRFFTMANIALPGTSSFVGEFMVLVGVFQTNTFVAVMSATGMVLGGAYSLWLYNRVVYGNLKTSYVGVSVDVNRREFFMFRPLLVLTLVMGIRPGIFLEPMHASVGSLIEHASMMS